MERTFIHEPISVGFDAPPTFSKTPHCPARFTWREVTYTITATLSEWKNYARRGRMQRNMRPANLKKAAKRGSWGVGEFYFRVRAVAEGAEDALPRTFEIYYDRAPASADDGAGQWFVYAELDAGEGQ